jgi:hypothetical protein
LGIIRCGAGTAEPSPAPTAVEKTTAAANNARIEVLMRSIPFPSFDVDGALYHDRRERTRGKLRIEAP